MDRGSMCAYCGDIGPQIEHLKPVSAGGGEEAWNLWTACPRCNSIKGNKVFKSLEDAQAYVQERRTGPARSQTLRVNWAVGYINKAVPWFMFA